MTCYIISLLSLTNIQIMQWIRPLWRRRTAGADELPSDMSSEEKALAKRAKELERQARQLQDQVDKSGIGADLKPVPEPTVRDLSIPQARKGNGKGAAPAANLPEANIEEGEVITAREIAAANSADVLGKSGAAKPAADAAENGAPETRAAGADARGQRSLRADQAKALSAQTQAHHRCVDADHRQLPASSLYAHQLSGHDGQADRIEGRAHGQRPADAEYAGAI